jgi:glycosyltransferase involved in cell wall biosynthesis
MNPISFIIPSRNNLKYLKQAYESIRENQSVEHEICIADDASTDGTMEQVLVWMKRDKNIKLHINKGPDRLGHTILYDTLINDYATHDRVMIFHADMILTPNSDKEVDKYLEKGKVVSLTRIEPPLHPDGPEKILMDFGIEPEEFKRDELLEFVKDLQSKNSDGIKYGPLALNREISEGIFAPWAIMKEDWDFIGGHDPIFAPQSKEDSDIFNRFHLAGYTFIQTWQGFVYHMTCRGSRFKDGAIRNPAGQVFMKNRESDEWLKQNQKSTREFIRKWGSFVDHDKMMKPIVPPKYSIGFVVENCNIQMLQLLEPWCDNIYSDFVGHKGFGANRYIEEEQTSFDLKKRIHSDHMNPTDGIVVRFDASNLTQENFKIIEKLPAILQDSGELGISELDIFNITIKSLKTSEKDLIQL